VRLRIPVAKPGVSLSQARTQDRGCQEATLANNTRLLEAESRCRALPRALHRRQAQLEYKFCAAPLPAMMTSRCRALFRIAKREPKFDGAVHAGESANPFFAALVRRMVKKRSAMTSPAHPPRHRDAKELSDGFPKAAEDLFIDIEPSSLTISKRASSRRSRCTDPALCSERGGALLMLGGRVAIRRAVMITLPRQHAAGVP